MDFGIAGRQALVMGASRGLGHACALALAREVRGAALEDGLLLGPLLDVLLVVARVAAQALDLERRDARDLLVQEVAVVRDQ